MKLRFLLIDEETDEKLGEGEYTVTAADKIDPEKFAMKVNIPLDTGGRIETAILFTSTDRGIREIFQACDPSKLLFGTFLLWINWYAFNVGSTNRQTKGGVEAGSRVAVTTTLGASAGCVISILFSELITGFIEPEIVTTGLLGGLVGITASCAVVTEAESVVIGSIGSLIAIYATRLEIWMQIDDPCSAFAIHGAAGIWGVIAVGLFAQVFLSPSVSGSFFLSVSFERSVSLFLPSLSPFPPPPPPLPLCLSLSLHPSLSLPLSFSRFLARERSLSRARSLARALSLCMDARTAFVYMRVTIQTNVRTEYSIGFSQVGTAFTHTHTHTHIGYPDRESLSLSVSLSLSNSLSLSLSRSRSFSVCLSCCLPARALHAVAGEGLVPRGRRGAIRYAQRDRYRKIQKGILKNRWIDRLFVYVLT
jgi:hypothetical protein